MSWLSFIFRLHSIDEIKCFKFCYPADLIFNHIPVNEQVAVSCTIDEINLAWMLGHEVFQKCCEGRYAGAASQKRHIVCIPNHEVPVGQLHPDHPVFMKFILHTGGVASPDGIGDL